MLLLLGVASLVGGCKKGKVIDVKPSKKVVEVGDTTTVSCTFNKGREVEWKKGNNNVFFDDCTRCKEKLDEKRIKGIKEGNCRITATGRKGTIDKCDITVKTYIRPKETIELHSGDTVNIFTRSGYYLHNMVENVFYCDLQSKTESEVVHNCEENSSNGNSSSSTQITIVDYSDPSNLTTLQGDDALIYNTRASLFAKHVGETNIRFYNTNTTDYTIDTGIVVKVLARYPDYLGFIDFDDTQDSVRMKVGNVYVEDYTNEGDLNWTYYTYPNTLLLNIIFDQNHDNDLVKSYGMAYSDEEIKAEVLASIEERFEYGTTYQGMRVYYNSDYSIGVGVQTLDNYLLVSVASSSSKSIGGESNDDVAKNMQVLINAMK